MNKVTNPLAEYEHEGEIIELQDGRHLGYANFGNPKGFPVFYFNGFPGSRFEGKFFDDGLKESQIRLIAVDRPGIGLSDPKPDRTLLDWPDDVLELADVLQISKFAIMGISGGGPYVAVCAYKIPSDRLVGAIIISGVAPIEHGMEKMPRTIQMLLYIARKHPKLLRFVIKQFLANRYRTPEKALRMTKKDIAQLPRVDRAIFTAPNLIKIFAADNYFAFFQGIEGVSQDAMIYAQNWGFNVEDIPPTIPMIIWHGIPDSIVPVEMGQYMMKTISHAQSRLFPHDNHFSTASNNIADLVPQIYTWFENTV